MYPKVDFPKKEPTKEWLDQAFAPLQDYLHKNYAKEADRIMGFLMFMGNEGERFYYKNSITRAPIVFDQSGNLVSLIESALDYEFDWLRGTPIERPPMAERFIHPNVEKWISSRLTREEDAKYGDDVRTFLQELWGPIANFDFNDLLAKFPLSPRGKQPPYCLFIYPSAFEKRIAFLFVGDEIVERRCTYKQYNEYRDAERNMMLEGWRVVTLYREAFDAELPNFLDRIVEIAEPRIPGREARR